MKDGVISIHGRDYKTVALRVSEFREDHPIKDSWAIITEELPAPEGYVKVRARIVNPEGRDVATGLAEEKRGASQINRTSALENCETSAIGRALAAAGYGGSEYASANEVENAIHQQSEPDVEHRTEDPQADGQVRFEAAINELVNRGAAALAIIGNPEDPYGDMAKRVSHTLGAHGAEAVNEITTRTEQLAFFRDLKATVESLEQQAEAVAEAQI